MSKFDNVLRNDTILNTGLLAIAIAWVALAAVRGPVAPVRDDPGMTAPTMSQRAADVARVRQAKLPAADKTIGLPPVS
jgi:hypothetical protein